ARPNADSRSASSCARPTSAACRFRCTVSASPRTARRRYAGTGSDFPFSSSGSTASTSTAWRTSRYVGSPTSTSSAGAACSRRAATFTASPVTRRCASGESPATTSPVFTPVLFWSVTPQRRSSSSFTVASAAFISAAARTARSASSSCACGSPNTAMIASPMYFSTRPPCRSSAARITSKYRLITSRSDSESSRSPRFVEPFRSEKTIVTVLRTSRAGSGAASGVPQNPHRRKRSGFSSPHAGQTAIVRVYAVRRRRTAGAPASAVEERVHLVEQPALALALRREALDLVADHLDVVQRLERGDQSLLLRAVLLDGREQERLLVRVDVEVDLAPRPPARPPAAPAGGMPLLGLVLLGRRRRDPGRGTGRANGGLRRDPRRPRAGHGVRRPGARRLRLRLGLRLGPLLGLVRVGLGRPREDAPLVQLVEVEERRGRLGALALLVAAPAGELP